MKKVVLIPHWVQDTLNRHKLQLVDVLDFQKIRGLFSVNDLAGCLAMECFEALCYGASIPDQSSLTLRSAWFDSATAEQKSEVSRIDMLSMDGSVQSDLKNRLFSMESRDERYTKPFITYDLSPSIGAAVIYPGYFVDGEEYSDTSLSLIESVLRVFYAYDSHHAVARSELFKQYLQLLSNKTVIV
jgi:hypothetical protein